MIAKITSAKSLARKFHRQTFPIISGQDEAGICRVSQRTGREGVERRRTGLLPHTTGLPVIKIYVFYNCFVLIKNVVSEV